MKERPAPSLEDVAVRVRRIEQQIRAFRELHTAEVNDLAEKLKTIAELQSGELQLILDELARLSRDLTPEAPSPSTTPATSGDDPAAGSAKRATWLAEEERRAGPRSRRELLRGREDEAP